MLFYRPEVERRNIKEKDVSESPLVIKAFEKALIHPLIRYSLLQAVDFVEFLGTSKVSDGKSKIPLKKVGGAEE